MKVIVTFSGGKDSLASLLWVRNNITKDFITAFCDTGWEHPLTYKYIEEIRQKLDLNLVTLKSKKFNGMVDLARKKTRWPSSQRRFCTSELKTIPMIDYVLDEVRDDMLMIQGIRAAESARRAEMSKQCTYFKYYVQPYGKDKHGKDKFHTYRRKDVLDALPKEISKDGCTWHASLYIDFENNRIAYGNTDRYGFEIYHEIMMEKNLINAAYSMLCWCIEQGYVETKKTNEI